MAGLSAALTRALCERGVPVHASRLAADAGLVVFKSAFQRWVDEPDQADFGQLVRDELDELRWITADAWL